MRVTRGMRSGLLALVAALLPACGGGGGGSPADLASAPSDDPPAAVAEAFCVRDDVFSGEFARVGVELFQADCG